MKSLEKLPTPENLDEIAQNDVLERNVFIANFIRLLASIEGHYSIALDGRWGSGKTFFVKQTDRVIKAYHNKQANQQLRDIEIFKNLFSLKEIISHPMRTFYYDAWQHDNRQDALLSIIYEIAKNAPSINPKYRNRKTTKVKIYNGIMTAAKGIVNHISGVNIENVMNDTKEFLQEIQKQDELESLFNDFFTNLLPDDKTRLVIFIDELDRCRPDYAVQLLERIKHYMNSNRITFAYALNYDQLQHTIKRYYGDDFEASMYLDKFFDLHIHLPTPNLFKRREAFLIGPKNSIFDEWCQKIADELKFEIREIIHFQELIKQVIYVDDSIFKTIFTEHKLERTNQTLEFLNYYFAPLALGYLVKDINLYYQFIDGENIKLIDILLKYINSLGFDYICKVFNVKYVKNSIFEVESEKNVQRTIKDYLSRLYDAVFTKIYTFEGESIYVGRLYVNGMIKQKFIWQISLLQ